MYCIEEKYKKLMLISKGKVPKLQKYDKQIRYSGYCARRWAAKVIIDSCQEDERNMLKSRIILENESAKINLDFFQFVNIVITGITLLMSTVAMVCEGASIVLPQESGIDLVRRTGMLVIIYVLLFILHRKEMHSIIKRTNFLLYLFDESK